MECVQTVMPGFLLLEVLGKTGFKVREKMTLILVSHFQVIFDSPNPLRELVVQLNQLT